MSVVPFTPITPDHRLVETPVLAVEGINVYYGESHILRDVDLQVGPGEMVTLIGRNGVGKTTLLKTVMGLLSPRRGRVEFQGQAITTLQPHQRAYRGIGYVPQGREIIPRLTVKENLILGLEANRQRATLTPAVLLDQVVTLFPILAQFYNRLGGNLSGGQQQQLAIGRALMGQPSLLVLDEPTEGIQPSIVQEIEDAVERIAREAGVAVLLVEQHLHFIRRADWYYAMQRGGIVASGPTTALSKEIIQEFLSV
jgi:urea transport system ATP-binding protein